MPCVNTWLIPSALSYGARLMLEYRQIETEREDWRPLFVASGDVKVI